MFVVFIEKHIEVIETISVNVNCWIWLEYTLRGELYTVKKQINRKITTCKNRRQWQQHRQNIDKNKQFTDMSVQLTYKSGPSSVTFRSPIAVIRLRPWVPETPVHDLIMQTKSPLAKVPDDTN